MRACVLLLLLVCAAAAFPQRHSNLQRSNEPDSPQFVEEVVVESVLQVRSADAGRQARTNTQTNLKDGARVSALRTQ